MRPQTTDEFYATFGKVFVDLVDSAARPRLKALDLVTEFAISDLNATITASFTPALLRTDLGVTDLTPNVVMRMSSEVAHQYLLGELNHYVALDAGELVMEGRVAESILTYPLVRRFVSPGYRAMLDGPLPAALAAELSDLERQFSSAR